MHPVDLPKIESPKVINKAISEYRVNAQKNGIRIVDPQPADWDQWVTSKFPDAKLIIQLRKNQKNNLGEVALEKIDVLIIDGEFGVEENGAVWVDTSYLPERVLPFITQHLIICIPSSNLLATMHDAYHRIDLQKTGFGVFIAGPSKTGDIEMVLVTGAQGPRTLTVCLY